MEFSNDTDCPGALFRSELEPDMIYNSVLARVRYRLLNEARLERLADEPRLVDIRRQPESDEYGLLEPDEFTARSGTDLIILGDAVTEDESTRVVDVRVTAGPYDLTVRVFGDRVWENSLVRGLVPSPPQPFTALPITLRNAFGGAAVGQYGPVPFPRNPDGKGYYLDKREAMGRPLPNIEDPHDLIRDWDDRPAPIGIGPYPSNWGLRLEPCLSFDPNTGEPMFSPESSLHDRAHPRLSGQRLNEGERVHIQGMRDGPGIEFDLPSCPLEVELRLGQGVHVRSLWLEEVLVDLRSCHIDLTYRKVFHYAFKPFQVRRTRLRWREGSSSQE